VVLGAAATARALEEGDESWLAGARLFGREAGWPERLKRRRNEMGRAKKLGRKPRRLQKLFFRFKQAFDSKISNVLNIFKLNLN
jgi:hypothetical protein